MASDDDVTPEGLRERASRGYGGDSSLRGVATFLLVVGASLLGGVLSTRLFTTPATSFAGAVAVMFLTAGLLFALLLAVAGGGVGR